MICTQTSTFMANPYGSISFAFHWIPTKIAHLKAMKQTHGNQPVVKFFIREAQPFLELLKSHITKVINSIHFQLCWLLDSPVILVKNFLLVLFPHSAGKIKSTQVGFEPE